MPVSTVTQEGKEPAPAVGDVGRLARRGAQWSILLTVGRHGIGFLTTMVLARLLAPADFGLFAMSLTFTVFLSVLSEAGLSWITVQKRDLTRQQVDNLFWITSGMGVALWGVCVIAGPLMARFYGAAELKPISEIVGIGFFVSGMAVQPMALLQRRIRVDKIVSVELASSVVGAGVGIVAALLHCGAWALVWQALSAQGARLIFVTIAAGYRPTLPHTGTGTIGLLGFGGWLLAYNVVTYCGRNLDNVLIGRACGATTLGYYSRAYFLMTLPALLVTSTLNMVMAPALAALRGDKDRMGHVYRKAVCLVAFIGCPLSAGLALTAPEAVRLVYGQKWMPVVPILIWLSIAGVLQPIHNTNGWLFIASGKVRAMFLWGAFAAVVLAGGFVVGLRWGAVGVAVSYAVVMTFGLTVPALYYAHRAAELDLRQTLRPVPPILGCVAIAAAAGLAAGFGLATLKSPWWTILTAKIAVSGLTYGALTLRFLRPIPLEGLERRLQAREKGTL